MTSRLLPLELRLRDFAESCPDRFPIRTENYWDRYWSLSSFLRSQIYPRINAGLACLSKSPDLYTDHGESHFDEVVRYAGELIEPTFSNGTRAVIEPYDLYLLLSAIRLHDAGNVDGREEHARRAYSILREAGVAVCPDPYEANLIGRIAEAHSGTTETGDRDTIHALDESSGFGPITCNPRLVAALVRFADEICEHSARASRHHISAGTLPETSKLFHLYADAVKQVQVLREQKAVRLKLVFDYSNLNDRYPAPHVVDGSKDKYLLDDAFDRIQKLDAERIYCNRYLPPELRTDKVVVTVEIVKTEMVSGHELQRIWKSKDVTIQERGYPSPNTQWRESFSDMTGAAIANELGLEAVRDPESI